MEGPTFQNIFWATLQIFVMGLVGYLSLKKTVIDVKGLAALSGLLVKVFMPCLIFDRLTRSFDYQKFPDWWFYPLLSLAVILAGYLVSRAVLALHKNCRSPQHFSALASFQNCGYVPLLLVAGLFSGEDRERLFVYIFLIVVGFDVALWSFGVWLLTSQKRRDFSWQPLLNPPLLTIAATLALIAWGGQKFFPDFIMRPVKMFGECTLPVAMVVAGGNLALTPVKDGATRDIGLLLAVKLFILPVIALGLVFLFQLPYLLGFLIVLQAAVPSAINLSVMCRHFEVDDRFVNQSLFWGSLVSVLTIPFFLTVYNHLGGR